MLEPMLLLILDERLPRRCSLGCLNWPSVREPIIIAYTSVRGVIHATSQRMLARYLFEWLCDDYVCKAKRLKLVWLSLRV